MDPMFDELRSAIYADRDEFIQFREVVVNSVIATDIFNEDATSARNKRWEKVFYRERAKEQHCDATCATGSTAEDSHNKKLSDLKATLMIDCIMQASDICPTMQHWHLYQKWNERRFKETCRAFQNGRASVNPSDRWYEWQLILFDTKVIPLAKKLKESGCFGSHAGEYLDNAKKNREQWFLKGSTIVQSISKLFAEKHNDQTPKSPSRGAVTAKKPRGVIRSRSNDSIVPTWDEVTDDRISRRGSVDNAPRTPRRSLADDAPADPAIVVAEMFANLPDLRRTETGKSDGAPTVPRRSCDMFDLMDDAAAVQAMFSDDGELGVPVLKREVSDGAPIRPRRSRDGMSLSSDVRAVRAMLSEDIEEPEMRQIISNKILNVPSELVPEHAQAITRRRDQNIELLADNDIASLQQQEPSLRSYRSRLDGSYVTENDESTILTMGNLWRPNHEHNESDSDSDSCNDDDDDDSTILTRDVA